MEKFFRRKPVIKPEYEIIKDILQREVIKRRTVDLVRAAHGKSMVIFLDKTARPIASLFIPVYRHLYPSEPRPEVRFVNIGTEKRWTFTDFFGTDDWLEWRNLINSVEVLRQVFGSDSVDYLIKVINPNLLGPRLVVDETTASGRTKEIAIRTLSSADPSNHYEFFSFIESDGDKRLFRGYSGWAHVPWDGIMNLVEDLVVSGKVKTESFSVSPQWQVGDSSEVRDSLQVRHELAKLAKEIIRENS